MRKLSLLLLASASLYADKVNYPANFQVTEGVDLFASADYLYWGVQEEGLTYAQSSSLHTITPSYDSGLRAGLGLNFPKEGYELALSWLWFKTDAQDHAHGSLIPLWAEPDVTSSASGHWHLNLNVWDLQWGRASWFGGHFSLTPFFGLRAAKIDQHLDIVYDTTSLHPKSDFIGGGLRAGSDGRFTFSHGFALYGTLSGSLLYGQFHTSNRFTQGLSSLQMALGLGWDTHLASDHCHLELHCAWEQNIWFGANQMNHLLSPETGNLSLQGLTVGGRFDF